jgi:flagellar biosynthesis/type III secretory pathway ATPase
MTAFYTVLVEGDDLSEPVADTVRSILDGHIVLRRSLAERNHYPAIDVLGSISRVMPQIVDADHLRLAGAIRAHLAEFEGARDLIEVGAYANGSNRAVDRAIQLQPAIEAFLVQAYDEPADLASTCARMGALGALEPMGAAA